MVDRSQARVLAMQALCQLEVQPQDSLAQLDDFLADEKPPKAVQAYARELVRDAHAEMQAIDRIIQSVAENWDLSRMATIDRNILRMAVTELRHRPKVPPRVVINEAVEIAKTFGTAESPGFVNGVLDAIRKRKLHVTEPDAEKKPTDAASEQED